VTLRHISTHLVGAVCGPIWWPVGAKCGRDIRADLHRRRDRFADPAGLTLRELLLSVMLDEDRDFQHARFTGDSAIVAVFWDTARNRRVVRFRELTTLPESADIADLLDSDAMSGDFDGSADYDA